MINYSFTSYSAGGRPLKIINVSLERMQRKIRKIKKKNSLGSEIIDWNNIDLSAGKGILSNIDRCFWTTKGRRVSLVRSKICGTKNIYQSYNIDPFYPMLAKLNKNKFKREKK